MADDHRGRRHDLLRSLAGCAPHGRRQRRRVGWRYTNTCASWASEVVYEIVGEDVDSDDHLGFETPRELGRNILILERADPTTPYAPKRLERNPATSLATSSR